MMFIAEFNNDYRVLLEIPENISVGLIESIIKFYYQKYYKKEADVIHYNISRTKFCINSEVNVTIKEINESFFLSDCFSPKKDFSFLLVPPKGEYI